MCDVKSFRFWCHAILPLVYDDSLSYMEFLCKVMQKLNEVIESVNSQNTTIDEWIKQANEKYDTFTQEQLNNYNTFTDNINTIVTDFTTSETQARENYEASLNEQWRLYHEDLTGQWLTFKEQVDSWMTNTIVQTYGNATDKVMSQNTITTLSNALRKNVPESLLPVSDDVIVFDIDNLKEGGYYATDTTWQWEKPEDINIAPWLIHVENYDDIRIVQRATFAESGTAYTRFLSVENEGWSAWELDSTKVVNELGNSVTDAISQKFLTDNNAGFTKKIPDTLIISTAPTYVSKLNIDGLVEDGFYYSTYPFNNPLPLNDGSACFIHVIRFKYNASSPVQYRCMQIVHQENYPYVWQRTQVQNSSSWESWELVSGRMMPANDTTKYGSESSEYDTVSQKGLTELNNGWAMDSARFVNSGVLNVDEMTNIGVYEVNADNTWSSPITGASGLCLFEVVRPTSDNTYNLVQRVTSYVTGKQFIRYRDKSNSTWSSWQDPQLGAPIPDGTDLNNLTGDAVYRGTTGASAQTMVNCPSKWAFRMECKSLGTTNRFVQIIYTLNQDCTTYMRVYTASGWGNWRQLVFQDIATTTNE